MDILPNSLFYKNSSKDEFELGLDDICVNIGNNKNNLFALPKIIIDNDFENLYDYILFDTPPSNNQITQSAFLYSDKLLIPTIMDRVSEIGVIHYWNKIKKIYLRFCSPKNQDYSYFKNIFGEEIVPIGVFETMRQGMSSIIENGVRDSLHNKLYNEGFVIFKTKIKELNDVIQYVYDLKSIYYNNKNVGEGTGRDIDIRGYKNLFDEIKGVL